MVSNIRQQFPDLFKPLTWGPIEAQFELADTPPAPETIANVSVVAFVGDQIVVTHTAAGYDDLPGGTLEPGETYMQTVERELLEEAGARLIPGSFRLFGVGRCHSNLPTPYRPHLPHPDFNRVVGYADAEIVQQPINPDGGEQIISVELLSIEDAVQRFLNDQRPDLADLCRLAAALRLAQY